MALRIILTLLVVAYCASPGLGQKRKTNREQRAEQPVELRVYGFNVGTAVYVVRAPERTPISIKVRGYRDCTGTFWAGNHVASLQCAEPSLKLSGTTTLICDECVEPKYRIEWHDNTHSAEQLSLTEDIEAALMIGLEFHDVTGGRLVIHPAALKAINAAGFRLDDSTLITPKGEKIALTSPRRKRVALSVVGPVIEVSVATPTSTTELVCTVHLRTGVIERGPAYDW